MRISRAFVTAATLSPIALSAQADTSAQRLQPIRVTVTRDRERPSLELPYAVSRVDLLTTRSGARRGALTDLLLTVPGVAVSNRFNPTQDPRVAVRGFGARSAFGIRGLRVLRDGVPLTIADGQAAIDFVDLDAVESIEVLRGAAGALYGNASGGVLSLTSEPLPDSGSRARLRAQWNRDAQRISANAAGVTGRVGWQGTVTRNTADGPRDYARFRSTTASGHLQTAMRDRTLRLQAIVYDSPLGQNPGAVTASELRATPTIADSLNIRRRARKDVQHVQLALSGERSWEGGEASLTAFVGDRALYNPQTFAIVAFDRSTLGLTTRVQQSRTIRRHTLRFATGADIQRQRDDRYNYTNCAGLTGAQRPATTCPTAADQGTETLHQLERVYAFGTFVRAEVIRAGFAVTTTLRADHTAFSVQNLRGTDPADEVSMGAVTPMMGVSYRVSPRLQLYGNLARSFETPTTTELATQPDGSAGLNRDLKPQRGQTLEGGAKGLLAGRFLWDVSMFSIGTRDELIPFEVPNTTGRRYFRNAGETSRRGFEASVSAVVGISEFGATVSHLRYRYEAYTVGTLALEGKRVPGVAAWNSSLWGTLRTRPAYATVEMQQAVRTPADDVNATWAPGWVLWNARVGLTDRRLRGLEPVLGIENAFDRTWVSNVVTNATRGRYYEPGAGRRFYVGLTLSGSR